MLFFMCEGCGPEVKGFTRVPRGFARAAGLIPQSAKLPQGFHEVVWTVQRFLPPPKFIRHPLGAGWASTIIVLCREQIWTRQLCEQAEAQKQSQLLTAVLEKLGGRSEWGDPATLTAWPFLCA